MTEYEELTWADALAKSRVRLPPPPPRPPGELAPTELAQARLAIASQAQALFVAPAPPRPAGLPLTTSRWRAWRAWRIERDVQRQRTAQQRAAWVAAQHERLEAAQAGGRSAVLHWQRELVPSYQHSWQQVYRQTRMEGPQRPAAGVPAWWR